MEWTKKTKASTKWSLNLKPIDDAEIDREREPSYNLGPHCFSHNQNRPAVEGQPPFESRGSRSCHGCTRLPGGPLEHGVVAGSWCCVSGDWLDFPKAQKMMDEPTKSNQIQSATNNADSCTKHDRFRMVPRPRPESQQWDPPSPPMARLPASFASPQFGHSLLRATVLAMSQSDLRIPGKVGNLHIWYGSRFTILVIITSSLPILRWFQSILMGLVMAKLCVHMCNI